MTGLDLTFFAETLSRGLKHFLKEENVKVKELDFKELENNIIMELELPYNQQMKTPTQLLNNFTKKNIILIKLSRLKILVKTLMSRLCYGVS
ncbi:MAG: hypothetical protein CL493_01185 [Actinobacteria bacterium]|nr:hypothetical protein [Actinomycetota bacterium]